MVKWSTTETLNFLGPRTWEVVLDYIKKVTPSINLN